ncbi:drug resistance transporter, EmrB/QacA subfamily [Asanoa hainanensis]|uniref:Drug resistance transporter, EmrB/QacA subfamily n=1 Tax=Asanoa hainanensis TaxID=560556 RepID=A0A239P608_9ACTN|nr:DHA2 family efflux MFS transporter permease subunit [Asanoa hainanensis]SNT62535.1 drug resistance transporter, EmrB/QacA subfamily [Asanoa hainanensis]
MSVAATAAVAAPTADPPAYRWRWVALFAILTAEVMDLLDALVTTIAGPTIRADLGAPESTIQWLAAGYTLAMAVGLVTGGRLGDLYGRRRMFLVGTGGFVAASLLCAVAQGEGTLVTARVLQGLFGAVLLPQGLGLIKEMFPPSQVGAAFGLFGPVMGLSAVGGPILAGWLVDADLFGLGWRMIFLVNLPIGLLGLVLALRFLPASRDTASPRLDLVGVGLVSAAMFLLVYPIVQGRELGWPAWTFASMAAALGIFGLFGWYEVRRQRRGLDPLVVPTLFRKRAFTGGLVAGTAYFAGMLGFSLTLSLYLQLGLGFSPLRTGLTTVPQAIGVVAGFGLSAAGGFARKHGRVALQAGVTVMALAVLAFLATVHLSAEVSSWRLAPALALFGIGMGLAMAPFFDIILAGVSPGESGSASGALNAAQQFAGALGVATLGTLFFNRATGPAGVPGAIESVLWAVTGLLALTFALSFLLPRVARPE